MRLERTRNLKVEMTADLTFAQQEDVTEAPIYAYLRSYVYFQQQYCYRWD
jgi:hypothetical protein